MSTQPVYAPLSGQIVALDDVPDPVFSQRLLGSGIAIQPAAGAVVAPAAGRVEALFPTGHAVGLRTPEGVDLLIHVGVDTAQMDGIFRPRVEKGQEVAAGELLVEFDLEQLLSRARSALVPVIATALPAGWQLRVAAAPGQEARAGATPIFTLVEGGEMS